MFFVVGEGRRGERKGGKRKGGGKGRGGGEGLPPRYRENDTIFNTIFISL